MTAIDVKKLKKAEKDAARHSAARNQISRGANLGFNILLVIACILVIFPLWIIIVSSITSEVALTTYGYRLWPLEFSTTAYTYLFRSGSAILTAYKNTLIATVAGTVLSVITVGLYAYALSRPDFRFKKFFTFFSFFTMLFGGGMVARLVDQMRQEFRTTVQKRDISKKHLKSNIPLAPAPKGETKMQRGMPNDSFWFPGEWEEVQAIVVTPDYDYMPATSQGSGYWLADPQVTGYADYYHYSNGWQQAGGGPYTSEIDVSTTGHATVAFYLMDAIQMGGAQAWVRIEKAEDSVIVKQILLFAPFREHRMH